MKMEPRNDTDKNRLNSFMEKLLNLSADQAGGVEVEWKALGEVAELIKIGKLKSLAPMSPFFITGLNTISWN